MGRFTINYKKNKRSSRIAGGARRIRQWFKRELPVSLKGRGNTWSSGRVKAAYTFGK